MFLLRRTVARAAAAAPSKAFLAKPRSIATYSPLNLRLQQKRSVLSGLQRRWASDEVSREQDEFSQTAAEAPVEEDLKPLEDGDGQEAFPGEDALSETLSAEPKVSGAEALGAAAGLATESPASFAPSRELYIGNLLYEVTEDQVRRIFSRFGPLTRVNLIKDNRGLSRGFGYVDFENLADATSAINALDSQIFEGRNLIVQYIKRARGTISTERRLPRPEYNEPSKTLFIGNMSFDMSDKDLNDLFREVRNVMDVRVAVDRRTGQPRGFAHADFLDIESATKAKDLLDSKVIYGRRLRVDYSNNEGGLRDRRPRLSTQSDLESGERGDNGSGSL